MIAFDQLTWLHGKPQSSGLLKANPEDFLVVEDLGFAPDGEGEHVLVRILKNGCNTRFVADALLGAAALGDIGKLFPDTDPAFKGADSRELLREAWRRIQAKGYTLGNVDVTIIAQAPKMLPHIPQMRVFIAEDLGCHMDDVNVKATTTEKLGFTGRGEGIACEAVALLRKADK